ncbi:MAG: hypothetical protein CMP76_10700 [Flavobacterium sp.]|nr:hypothetical protein [Flavobacterium sp.]|tara:strand:+ start:4274 stop:5002 length:729 start_codon:yes stop_codon:yes gene_type:complete
MKYFAIESSLDEKIMGKVDQCKEYIHHCNVWEDPNFIDRFPFEKIHSKPILSTPVLHSNAKLTDLIKTISTGFSFGSMIISDKFKSILDDFNCFGIQYFQTYLIYKSKEVNDYWQTHISEIPYSYIDFENTKFFIKNSETRRIDNDKPLEIKNLLDFNNKKDSLEYPFSISINEVQFDKTFKYDYFFLRYFENGGNKGIVSERLKEEIEKQGCTGIEFRPIEMSLQDWYHSGERERIYGKSY